MAQRAGRFDGVVEDLVLVFGRQQHTPIVRIPAAAAVGDQSFARST
jgi:hypothetical protein